MAPKRMKDQSTVTNEIIFFLKIVLTPTAMKIALTAAVVLVACCAALAAYQVRDCFQNGMLESKEPPA